MNTKSVVFGVVILGMLIAFISVASSMPTLNKVMRYCETQGMYQVDEHTVLMCAVKRG